MYVTAHTTQRLYDSHATSHVETCFDARGDNTHTHGTSTQCGRVPVGPAPPVAGEQRAQRLQALGGAGRKAVLAARILHDGFIGFSIKRFSRPHQSLRVSAKQYSPPASCRARNACVVMPHVLHIGLKSSCNDDRRMAARHIELACCPHPTAGGMRAAGLTELWLAT